MLYTVNGGNLYSGFKSELGAGDMAHSVKCFPKINIKKPGFVTCTCDPSTGGYRNRQIDPRSSLAGKCGLIHLCQVPVRDPVFENPGRYLLR